MEGRIQDYKKGLSECGERRGEGRDGDGRIGGTTGRCLGSQEGEEV